MSSKDVLKNHLVSDAHTANVPASMSKRAMSRKHFTAHAEGASHSHPAKGSPSERLNGPKDE